MITPDKIIRRFQVKLLGEPDMNAQNALETEPENLREAMKQWRILQDHIQEVKSTIADHEERVKELRKYVMINLEIPEGQEKSETISIPGVGMAYKKTAISCKVTDWDSFNNYLSRHKMEGVRRHQVSLAPALELYELIMAGELPKPKSAEFSFFEKLTLRRVG